MAQQIVMSADGELRLADGTHVAVGALADDGTYPTVSEAVASSATQAGTLVAPTATTQWAFQPTDPAKAPFKSYFAGGSFSSTWNTVWYQGYNADRASGSEPSARFVIEQDYNNGSVRLMEMYWETATAGGGTSFRPVFADFNRSTGASNVVVTSTTFAVNDTSDNTAFNITHADRQISLGYFSGGNSRIKLRAQTGFAILFDFDANGGSAGQMVCDDAKLDMRFGGAVGFAVGNSGANAKLGFYGTTPITKPTGVAVTAAGVHAALVSLGLIAA